MGSLLPKDRRYPTREEFAADHGATAEDMAKDAEAFARDYGLDIVEESPARRSVVLMGTVGRFARAFGIKLSHLTFPGHLPRKVRSHIPACRPRPSVLAVLGLDNRPPAKSHFRLLTERAAAAGVSYTPPQVAGFYNFPSGLDGGRTRSPSSSSAVGTRPTISRRTSQSSASPCRTCWPSR